MKALEISDAIQEEERIRQRGKQETDEIIPGGTLMNEVMECILKRRSIRKFKAEMPKKEDIDQIID